jgi:hypothetical protein
VESLLIITGTMGAGKTSVLAEASDILKQKRIVHAAVDLDALGLAYLPSTVGNDEVMYRNFASVCENYEALGVSRLLLARAMEGRAELDLCCKLASATHPIICRLNASVETAEQRVRLRESGALQRAYVARVARLNVILDGAALEDFAIINVNRALNEVANELLVRAGWI